MELVQPSSSTVQQGQKKKKKDWWKKKQIAHAGVAGSLFGQFTHQQQRLSVCAALSSCLPLCSALPREADVGVCESGAGETWSHLAENSEQGL